MVLRDAQDLANQVRHSVQYRESLEGAKPGRFLTVEAGEYLSGLPLGWTMPYALNEVEPEKPCKARMVWIQKLPAASGIPPAGNFLVYRSRGLRLWIEVASLACFACFVSWCALRVCRLQLFRVQLQAAWMSLWTGASRQMSERLA